MVKISEYKYVDFWHNKSESDTQHKWNRIELSEIDKYCQKHGNFNCFNTVQMFNTKDGSREESFIAPFYFDLDYESNPEVSRLEAIVLIKFLIEELTIPEAAIRVFFSGKKGFHIIIHWKVFGYEPSNKLHLIFKHIAGYLAHSLGDPEPLKAIDYVVYSSKRMLRIPNSVHVSTNLYKIELSLKDLQEKSLEEIKTMAASPRLTRVHSEEQIKKVVKLVPTAKSFFDRLAEEWSDLYRIELEEDRSTSYKFNTEKTPVCVEDILSNGWKKENDRNQATLQLACFFKEAGYEFLRASTALVDWVARFSSANTNYELDKRIISTRNVLSLVYSSDDYRFSCKFMRSLHGLKKPGDDNYERVKCVGSHICPHVINTEIADVVAEELHLAKTADSKYSGKLVKTRVMVAGKKSTPYIVPSKIEYSCWSVLSCKKGECPLNNVKSGTIYKDLSNSDRELIQMCGVGDDNIRSILKTLSRIPNCSKYEIKQPESVNVEELLVIPMVEVHNLDVDEKSNYVLRKIYSVGNLGIQENKYYEITGYVFSHPKTQEGTILVQEAKPLQDIVESFELTDEVKESLKIFRTGNSVEEIAVKVTDIMDDLTANVTGIVDRNSALLGILLVYHSVLRINVPWNKNIIRGWLETVIIGDTGTGKSDMMNNISNFVQLGAKVNAESTTRTGLTYKMEQTGSGGAWFIVWGAWPLADKELIWIDECSGIPKEEYGQMTMARSDGRLEVKRAVTAETTCRVRSVLSGNVPKGKRLADFAQGVESLKQIFNNEDIRRFDFGMFLKSTDVSPEKYNQPVAPYPNRITGDTLKNNILFSWSRNPENVIITKEAADKILETSVVLSKMYGNATDVPLVSPSDQRNKIARISVALASMLNSVDETGETVVVYPGHVEFISSYLKHIYNEPGSALNYYARLAIKEEVLTDEQFDKVQKFLISKVSMLRNKSEMSSLVKVFAAQQYLSLQDMEAMLSVDKETVKDIVATLQKARMISRSTGGFRKTARFNSFIDRSFSRGVFDDEEDII